MIIISRSYAGSQQQWLTRNCELGGAGSAAASHAWKNGVWNMVFVGCEGVHLPPAHCGIHPAPAPPAPPAPTPPSSTCAPCTNAECGLSRCAAANPYACLAGQSKGGCNSNPTFWLKVFYD